MSRFRRAALPRARRARTALARAALAGLGLACALLSGCGRDPSAPLPADTPVVMVVVDTLSALHLELYGYEHSTAPHLTEFARAATVFEHNTTQCNSTFPSITSILTGLYPKTHKNLLAVPTEGTFQTSTPGESLAERLAARGYHTLAVGSHPSWLDSGRDAIHRGWKRFSAIPPDVSEPRALWANGAYTNERAFALLDEYERAPEGPLFLWVHYFDPHTDLENLVYAPPAEVRDRFLDVHLAALGVSDYAAELRAREPSARADYLLAQAPGPRRDDVWLANGRALYDAEIAYCDAQIARLFARLDELGILERALVVVLADHGENMDGRDTEAGRIDFTHLRLFETVARTPLILKLPSQRTGQRIAALTQNIDVLPTVLELLDLPRGAPVDGASLAGLLSGELERVHERVFIESSDNIEKAVRGDEWKYFDSDGTYAAGLFRWRADGLELDDRAAAAPAVAAELQESLQAFRPVETLRLVCTPAAEPYSVVLELELPRSAVRSATDGAGRAAGEIEDGGRRFRFAGRVEGQPLALVLELQNRKPPFRWTLRKDGRAPEHGEVRLGQLALDQSAAIPLFRGALGEAAAAAADPTAPWHRAHGARRGARARRALAAGRAP